MSGAPAEILAVALLLVTLAAAVIRPRGISEAVVAVPAAAIVILCGAVPGHAAWHRLGEIGPTVAFLAAILAFGHLCADAGVFEFLGNSAARASRGRPRRLLLLVVVLAAAITATLTLDATVVLLTPVVLLTARRLAVPARPHLYACTRLANSASLLLPVSNLTNLLVFSTSGLTFGRFTALMTLPWLLVITAEWLGLRTFFADDLTDTPAPGSALRAAAAPRYALTVLVATLAGFVVTSSLDVAPAWAALAGCVALLIPRLARRDIRLRRLVASASPGFCIFVLALAVIVEALTRNGLGHLLRTVLPTGQSLPALLGIAALSAVLANAVNNLPATLALAPIASGHPAELLAVLLGVNIGPNATYPGSLATLLWRRRLPASERPSAAQFHLFGALTVPILLVVAVAALWLGVHLIGT